MSQSRAKHVGRCHCGSVQVSVVAPKRIVVDECNCSICSMSGYLHLIVDAADFELVRGQDALTTYQFGTKTARHYFCRTCGVKPFYVPRSHPNGFSVNLRCLDQSTFESVKIETFDGKNWEANVEALRRETDSRK